jgi:UDP-N-acetyl-D-mannosaminuronic acid dehydrogenase
LVEGKDISLVFAPERVLQTKAIEEIASLPQLIGAFNDQGFEKAKLFFEKFVRSKIIRLSPLEAELGKLITNMARYVSFALANEFYLLADNFGANAHRIIAACNFDYPRLDIPSPGPNVGGPCLYKDGYYLLNRLPFPEIISCAFKINESMPAVIINKILQHHTPQKVGVLGLTFKANCDDIRNSLSFKLRKQLRNERCEIVDVDPYVAGTKDFESLRGVDTLILMTPHDQFRDLRRILNAIDNKNCLIVDLWNFWSENLDLSHDGLYTASEVIDPK